MKTLNPEEKFEKQDFNLFDALTALDKKDYNYFKNLTEEQQRKFVPYMLIHWMSAVKSTKDIQGYYLCSVDYHANRYLFNETIQKHPKLQWLMLCASSPGIGKQFHQWIPHLTTKVSLMKEPAKLKDVKEYFTKIYPSAKKTDIEDYAKSFVDEHKRKCYLAKLFPNMKYEDIETLNCVITDKDIEEYEKDRGN